MTATATWLTMEADQRRTDRERIPDPLILQCTPGRDRTDFAAFPAWKATATELDTGGNRVQALEWSPHGDRVLTASLEGSVQVFDPAGQERSATWVGRWMRDACFRDDGRILAGAGSPGPTLLDPDTGTLTPLVGHGRFVWCVGVAADQRSMITGSQDQTARIWSRDGECTAVLSGHVSPVIDVALSRDGRWAATVSGGAARVFDGQEGTLHATWAPEGRTVRSLHWSPTADLLAVTYCERDVAVLDTGGTVVTSLETTSPVRSAAWSPRGDLLAVGAGSGAVTLCPVDGSEPIRTTGHDRIVTALAWLPSGDLVTAGRDDTLRVWGRDGKERVMAAGVDGEVRGLRVSPRGDMLGVLFTSERSRRPWLLNLRLLLR